MFNNYGQREEQYLFRSFSSCLTGGTVELPAGLSLLSVSASSCCTTACSDFSFYFPFPDFVDLLLPVIIFFFFFFLYLNCSALLQVIVYFRYGFIWIYLTTLALLPGL